MDQVVERHGDYVKAETLAVELRLAGIPAEAHQVKTEIAGVPIEIGVVRV
jgi:hypothetical protein